jgi:hypothetical protein
MSAHLNPNIVEDGLVFIYDTGNRKSYVGEPTINYIYNHNAVAQDSYSAWSATSSGTYNAKHPDAIIAYNAAGSQMSGYYNSGVSDAANTYHAHWQYDSILKKPVVVMNDLVGSQWKAKWMSTGLGSWNSQSKSHGDTYTISWLQWVDHLSKNAKAGLYTKNTSGGNGFHDGQANSASSYNTILRTWQRVYQTYTTNTVRDLSQTLATIYMYGHHNVRATVKIADVQFTWGSHPVQFSAEYERSDTEALIDRTGNSTIDLSNVSFDSDAQMVFDGTDDYIALPNDLGYSTDSVSVFSWYKINGSPANSYHIICGDSALELSIHSTATYLRNGVSTTTGRFVSNNGNQTLNDGNYHYYGFTFDGSTKTAYIDGVALGTQNVTGTLTNSFGGRKLGAFGGGYYANGNISVYKVFNKVLTAAEVLQNYNATKSRFEL